MKRSRRFSSSRHRVKYSGPAAGQQFEIKPNLNVSQRAISCKIIGNMADSLNGFVVVFDSVDTKLESEKVKI